MASRTGFAQRNEEEYILTLEGKGRLLEGKGRLLDVGSYDGRTFSNSRALSESGWEGVYVEPAAHAFAAMLDDPPPNAQLVNALIGPRTGICSFLQSRDAVSTTDRAHARRWQQHASFQASYTVSISPSDFLREFPGPYRFISVDTEGTSMWLFHEISPHLDRLETEMICVEHDGAHPHLDGWVSVYRSAENEILRRC